MFEVKGQYANRKGKYTVLAINNDMMTVRYEDGTEASLKMAIQQRIWENISSEIEEAHRKQAARRGPAQNTQYFIKAISLPSGEILFPGWHERVVMAPTQERADKIKPGDRLIYYAIESKVFFAVVTITGNAVEADPKKYLFTTTAESAFFFPVDTDAAISSVSLAVPYDSMELESQPKFRTLRIEPESFLPINEDDFELLAELVTELTEGDDDEDEEEEEEEFIEEDDI
ncbi:MAG: EVE domain-containing protein [Ardenticatenaceae bacterium]|nr:EVE domain-containing protein [Ardenticatenaceae bacterium]